MVQQVLIAVDFLMYGRTANKYCMLVRYDIRSISYSVLLNSVLIVAYQYWYVANKIYKFTQKGILPKQRSKFRNKSILLLLSVVSIMTTIVFLTLLQVYVFFDNSLLMDGRRIDILIKVFALGSLVTQIITFLFYSLALHRLIKIKPMAQHAGCLDAKIIGANLITYSLFIASMILSQFQSHYSLYSVVLKMAYYILFFLVMAGIVYILMINQLTSFNIKTQLEGNMVAVIGEGLDGNEKFRFIIESE